jgi:UDPglucose 6-dehydrogenase
VKRQQMLGDLNYLNTREHSENEGLLSTAEDAYQACADAHAIAVLTEWDEFKALDWRKIYQQMAKPAFVFDGRAILNEDNLGKIGFQVYRIGKH